MKFKVKTAVPQPLVKVWQKFDDQLLQQLTPPYPILRLLRYEGNHTGDLIILELDFVLFKQRWKSQVVNFKLDNQYIAFTDQGIQLPFFLSTWQHTHQLEQTSKQHTIITDEVEYHTPMLVLDYLLYPLLFCLFLYRRPIYKRIFADKVKTQNLTGQ
ncbi:hypothetical protein AAG747_26190 [Rapidithrix thailandica]|uniref:Ligand-binding SRPBCC domain-containing protein n=1 Tax=Rapidithrix thailandica TaxID=413964 RepID=A0AAW9SGI2_9BACT